MVELLQIELELLVQKLCQTHCQLIGVSAGMAISKVGEA